MVEEEAEGEKEREKNATQCAPHSQHWRLLKPIISSVISLVLSHLFTYFFPFRVIISSIFIASSFILIFSPHLFFPFLLNRHLLHGSYSFIFARSIPFSYFYLNESNIQLAVFISFQINFIWIRLFKTARFFNPHDANICCSCLTFHQFKHSRAVAVSKLGLRVVVFFLFCLIFSDFNTIFFIFTITLFVFHLMDFDSRVCYFYGHSSLFLTVASFNLEIVSYHQRLN